MEAVPKTSADRAAADAPGAMRYSVIVPCYNEEKIIETVHQRITRVMRHLGRPYEIVLVNDGSRDGTAGVLERLARADAHTLFVDLRRNFGKSAALQAGFDHCRGEVIITMDGDLQNDPYEIPFFVKKIDEGFDIASGRRARRRDNFIMRRVPSKIANWLMGKISGLPIRDFGGGYKAYRREVLQGIHLYGDMMRFIPALCNRMGATMAEVPIKNVRRRYGKSNYGIGRAFRVSLDLITIRFLGKYMTRPLHFFGKWAMLLGLGGSGILGYLAVRKVLDWSFSIMQTHGPLMMLGFMLMVVSLLLLATGLIGEMLMRIYFESTGTRTYAVRKLVRKDGEADL
jgi:glycosyltransferase involved in cell wall biosynthesis